MGTLDSMELQVIMRALKSHYLDNPDNSMEFFIALGVAEKVKQAYKDELFAEGDLPF